MPRLLQHCLIGLLIGCPHQFAPAAAEELPELEIALGATNSGTGLIVPSDGDGVSVPVQIGGIPARCIAGERSLYLYVRIDHPKYAKGPRDLYVVVEAFDEAIGRLSLQYDKADPSPNIGTKYTAAADSMLLIGSGQWRRGVFHLPSIRLGHGQNFGADFRLCGKNVAIRRITVTPRRPADYDPDRPLDPETLRSIQVDRPSGMELTFGNDAGAADAALFRALSVTSVESYVDWAGVEPRRGRWDWSKWDKQVQTLEKAGLKWVPFLIAGPAYATPLWFQQSPDSHRYRCLEHGRDSKVQSLFNPHLRPQVERFLAAFAERYRDTGVVESVLLGITGIYGESIYPAGPEGGWTARLTGDYHNHGGWWAGDSHAAEAFRAAMRKRYSSIAALNQAWGTDLGSFDDVAPFLPDKAPSDRARADFVEWYQEAMTDWAVFWVRTARRHFPQTAIYLCTGGDGNPFLGADFTAQTAAIAPEGAGIRITNEGSNYQRNFALTREVATATRHYGTFCGFEPASHVDAGGVVARVYNATASGARQLHDYIPNTLGQGAEALENFRTSVPLLVPRRPRIDTAVYLSRETWALDPDAIHQVYGLSHELRDATDLDFLTRRSIADGHLEDYRLLVLSESPVLEPEAAAAIEAWVRDGGTLVAATRPGETLGGRLYDNAAWRERMFAAARAVPAGLLVPTLNGDVPSRWALRVGGPDDEPWLFGDWHGRESGREWPEIPDATKRWTGADCGVLIPVKAGDDSTLRLSAIVPGLAINESGITIQIDGRTVGRINKAGKQDIEIPITAGRFADSRIARLRFACRTWKPSEHEAGSKDDRALGFALRQIELVRGEQADQPATKADLRFVVDRESLDLLVRMVGKGKTVFLPGAAADARLVATTVASLLEAPVDGRIDGRFATETEDGVLWFDRDGSRMWQTAR